MKTCTICSNEYMAKDLCLKHYREKNHERILMLSSKWGKEHIERVKEKNKLWNKNNSEKRKIWRENNPAKTLQYSINHLNKLSVLFDMNSMEYKYALRSWSKAIKKRDNICKLCNSKENLHAHHIQPKNEFPKQSLDLDNGVTLCKNCHYEVHGYEIPI